MKTELSSFDVAAVVSELKQRIIETRIKNIYQTSRSTILLKLHKPNEQLQLLIEAGRRFHLTGYVHEIPSKPPAFCMALRKYLRNGRIREVFQHDFERIAVVKVDTKHGEMMLIAEFFGEGNIILVGSDGRIVQALTYRKMRDRNIVRNEVFVYPPSRGKNPFKLKLEDMEELKNFGETSVVKALTRFLSIGGLYAEEILQRASVEKATPCKALTKTQIKRVFEALSQILSKISRGTIEPAIIVDAEGEYVDVTPLRLVKYEGLKHVPFESFNEALDEFYSKTTSQQKVAVLSEKLTAEIERQERILESQRKALEKAKQQIERNRRIGDLIYMHMHELQQLMDAMKREKEHGKTWEEIVSEIQSRKREEKKPEAFFESFDQKQLILNVSVENMSFPLKLRKTVQENAASFYARAKKAEKKLRGIMESMRKTEEAIEKLRRKSADELRETEKVKPLKAVKREWYEKFRWFRSSEGFLVLGGRDAATNEMLIKRHMEPQDIVFHADLIGAPFVLIKTEGKTPSEQTLREAAEFAAAYSKAWKQKLAAVDVYWVRPEQVSKQPPSGQYLTKGAFMIRGKKTYYKKIPLKTAIGIIIRGKETPRIIGGPTSAIAKNADAYVEIAPNDTSAGKLAEQILQTLIRKTRLETSKQLRNFLVEEIRRFLPAGKGKIIGKAKET